MCCLQYSASIPLLYNMLSLTLSHIIIVATHTSIFSKVVFSNTAFPYWHFLTPLQWQHIFISLVIGHFLTFLLEISHMLIKVMHSHIFGMETISHLKLLDKHMVRKPLVIMHTHLYLCTRGLVCLHTHIKTHIKEE